MPVPDGETGGQPAAQHPEQDDSDCSLEAQFFNCLLNCYSSALPYLVLLNLRRRN
jgi:hypothetical protein